jgi:predicted NAD/FAD-binding protein
MTVTDGGPLEIAVIGSGISGLSAAWLLSQRHRVSLFEQSSRAGGHSNTVDVGLARRRVAVDTGFIVYNEPAYPNLSALFAHLGVKTDTTDMTFSVSLGRGRLEYGGGTLSGLFAQPVNMVRPRFWSMLRDIVRFYRLAPGLMGNSQADAMTLGELIDAGGFGRAFRDDHILPMAGAIWSAPAAAMADYPAVAFVRFFENHGLLKLSGRPLWRTVAGGSRQYVSRMLAEFRGEVHLDRHVASVRRVGGGINVTAEGGETRRFDHVVIATHADQALRLLPDADDVERQLLGAFRYSRNRAVLHSDPVLMPRRRRAWASWNYLSTDADNGGQSQLSVTYWMNRLQRLDTDQQMFVTLNPAGEPEAGLIHHEEIYEHPIYDAGAHRAQRRLWTLQGRRRTWFCGAYFGAGFHEDGLQSGLALAEQLGGVRRPWQVPGESDRIFVGPAFSPTQELVESAA